MTKLILKVKGMHCASCAILIDKLVGKQAGVVKAGTSYGAGEVNGVHRAHEDMLGTIHARSLVNAQ